MRKVSRIVPLMLAAMPVAVMLGCTERTDLAPVWAGYQNLNEAFPHASYPPPVTNGHVPPAQRPQVLPPVPVHRDSGPEKMQTHSEKRQTPAPAAKPDGVIRDKKRQDNSKPQTKASTATAKKNNTPKSRLDRPARKSQVASKKPADSRPINDNARLSFGWPLAGKILKNYNQTSKKGIKIAGKKGQSVRAAEGGKVVYSGQGLIGYGNLLIIKHNDQYLTAYANNDALLAKEGDFVNKGQKIATVGVGAASRRAMLHFEIRNQGKSVNPLKLLPKL
jgi:lipoprotein NlpD